ncbi:MAG: sigma-70 family RNA polymerase sigma factor [Planctomycetota bacterium]
MDLDRADLTWLRHLARALVAEPHAADDLMQDTLLAATRRPDVQPTSMRAWLAGIARRLAARRFRDRQRRERREAEATAPRSEADPADLVARAELAEQLARAASRLPEPMRTAVLLRFLEGLDVAAIARRTGKPDDTVRYRIRRGLDLLRRDLGGSENDVTNERRCRALLLPLAAPTLSAPTLPAPPTPPPPTTTAPSGLTLLTIMNAKNVTVVALAALLLTTLTWWAQSDDQPSLGNEEARLERPTTTAGEGSRTPVAAATNERTLVPAPTPQPAGPSRQLLGLVVDEQDQPVAGASLALRSTTSADGGASPAPFASATSDTAGRFELPRTPAASELLVRRNGFRRSFVLVEPAETEQPLRVVMRRGGEVFGRVVDGAGRGVPDLELIAYTEGAGIEHMSPTQSALKARKANAGPAESGYEQCRARTDESGHVRFTGLADGKVRLRSCDPAWTIEQPTTAVTNGSFVLWTAAAGFGVELTVRDADGRPLAGLTRARFHFEAVQANGLRHDLGKWVGRGDGKVTWGLTAECVSFPVADIREVVFYGEAGDGTTWTEWRSKPLFRAGETVRVRVDLPRTAAVEPSAQPTATLELQVFDENGAPWRGEVFVRWRSVADRERTDSAPASIRADGRHRLEVPAGKLELEIQQRYASGSIQPWRGEVFAEANGLATATVRLPLGATAVVTRPAGFDGTWSLHASYRTDLDDEWFGSWNYGTDQEQLVLNALQPAQWKFELRRSEDPDEDPIVRLVTLRAGERQTVSR